MRNTLSILVTGALAASALFCSEPASASVLENASGYNAFAGSGTDQGTTNSYYVAGNFTLNPGTPVLRYINVASDLAPSKVTFYTLTNMTTIVNPTNTGLTNFVVASTNGYASNNIIVIKHLASDTYERLPVWFVGLTNQITVKYPPLGTCAQNDPIWMANAAGVIPIGVASNSVPTGPIDFLYAGQYKLPLLFEVNGTSTAHINACAGNYLQ